MKVLVLHPKDPTTDFLIDGYSHTDFNVINSSCSKSALKRLMNDHTHIVMMGHGGEIGLYGFKRMVVDSTMVYILRQKPHNTFIWCNADKFVFKYGLKGFATGMIISEYVEAIDYAVRATDTEIDESNKLFAKCIQMCIELSPAEMYDVMMEQYVLEGNPVVEFNRQNLFLFE